MAQIKRVKKGYRPRFAYRDHGGNYKSKRKTYTHKRHAEVCANSLDDRKFSYEQEKQRSIELEKHV